MDSRILSAGHACESGVDKPWERSNEDWWDWYLSLADDAAEGEPGLLTEPAPPDPWPCLRRASCAQSSPTRTR